MNTPEPPSDIDALLEAIRQEEEKQRASLKMEARRLWIKLAAMILACIFLSTRQTLFSFLFVFVAICASARDVLVSISQRESQQPTIDALLKADAVRVIGPLCDAYAFAELDRPRLIEEALTRLLPKLKASDAALLTPSQRYRLYLMLHGDNAPLVLAILRSLEQIGDGKALPYVEPLAEGNGKYLAAKDGRVWLAARECLPFLLARAEKERLANTLLRPAEETASPDTLLRPAAAQSEAGPEQLLRPSTADEE